MHLSSGSQLKQMFHSWNYFVSKEINWKLLPLVIACLVHFVQLELAQPPSMMEPKSSKAKANKMKNTELPTETPKMSPAQNMEGKVISVLIVQYSTCLWRRAYWNQFVVLGKRQLATIMIRWLLFNLMVHFLFFPNGSSLSLCHLELEGFRT